MRFAPLVGAAALMFVAGAFTSVCLAPPATASASPLPPVTAPAAAEAPLAIAPAPRVTAAPLPGARAPGLEGETLLVIEGSHAPPASPSPAILWLALSLVAGVAMRIVIALVEERWGLLLVLACTSLFLSGVVIVGA
ncbi:MAG: hypothetical protein H6711_19490 [Myxococcales bacterium]|nr:hypothetical protein [Myxococcales bacterium]